MYLLLTYIPGGGLLTGFAMRSDPNVAFGWLDPHGQSGSRGMTSCLPARREEVGAPPPDRPLHHPRPGIYNAVLRSDRFGTGHRLGIQNAPAGGPSQITDHYRRTKRKSTDCDASGSCWHPPRGPIFWPSEDAAEHSRADLLAQRGRCGTHRRLGSLLNANSVEQEVRCVCKGGAAR